MFATEPAWKPQINRRAPHEGAFSQHPTVKGALRALNLVAGFTVALAGFVVVGFYAALLGCVGEETHGLCVNSAWLVPWLEWPIVAAAVAAPLAGGIASFVKRDPVWLVLGVVTTFAMGGLMGIVSTGQTALLG